MAYSFRAAAFDCQRHCFLCHQNNRRLAEALDASNAWELLRISGERHRLLADNATDVIWIMGLDRHFSYVSPSVEKLIGYTSSEVMQQSFAQVFTAESITVAERVLADLMGAASAGGESFVEYRGELEHSADTSTVWVDITISSIQYGGPVNRHPRGEPGHYRAQIGGPEDTGK